MLSFVLALMMFQYYPPAAPEVPAATPNPEYPLHLRVLNTHWNWFPRLGYVRGYGRANLLGPPAKGVDYTYSCSEPFLHNQEPGEFYQAKWKKQDHELTLLLQKVGSNKTDKCDVKVALHDAPYGKAEAAGIGSGPESGQAPAAGPAAISPPSGPVPPVSPQ